MAIVKKYPAKVTAIHNYIKGVYTLEMESLGKPFKYEPGQFLHLAIDEYDSSGQWPDSRCFSMQSAPGEELIRITYAVKGKFTGRMQEELKPGSKVTLKLPYGDLFIKPHNKNNTVFIAGGTGITPFLSLFNDWSFKSYNNPVLFAGFRNKSMNIYHAELARAGEINPAFIAQYYYEDLNGLIKTGDVFSEMGNNSTYFISGPPAMIIFFKQSLHSMGINLARIKTDDWE